MKKQKVISPKSLPARLPIWQTAVVWLLLDRFHAPGWVQGAVWMLIGVFWVLSAVSVFYLETRVDISEKLWP